MNEARFFVMDAPHSHAARLLYGAPEKRGRFTDPDHIEALGANVSERRRR